MREWIADFTGDSEDTGWSYLIKSTEDGDVRGWQRADFSGVLNMLHTVAWDNAYGEGVTTVDIFLLAEMGVMPCRVDQTALPELGMVCVEVYFRDPLKRGKAALTQADKGFRQSVEG